MSFLTNIRRASQVLQSPTRVLLNQRNFHSQSSFRMAANLNSENISKITEKEKTITGSDQPAKGGPTAQAQSNAGQPINSQTLHDITEGEKTITGSDRPVKGGPTAAAQSILTSGNQSGGQTSETHTGKLDSSTISKITDAEKDLTGSDNPARGGPTAQAQKHAGENIGSENLSDITAGEKKITGGERVKGGPTAAAQSELGKSRE